MLKIFISLVAILILLVSNEILWRLKKLSDELARKIVHISGAVFVAFWPLYMSYKDIQLIAIAFLIVIAISRYLRVFQGMVHVKRRTYGDFFAPISIFILATLAPNKLVFAMAMLQIGVSDGIAALIGKRFGKNNTYKIVGQIKSVAGTMSFILAALAILVTFKILRGGELHDLNWFKVFLLPPILAIVENISVYGSDDLTIPLVFLVGLRWL